MTTKSGQLQIRVSPGEKEAIRRAARAAGMDLSAYVLACVLPSLPRRFSELTAALREPQGASFALAELNEWMSALNPAELVTAAAAPPRPGLTLYLENYVAAMVEQAFANKRLPPPAWTRSIARLPAPVFGSSLQSLRLHLLTHSPAAFRRRDIFIDSTLGSRV
jgi:hypothetical protein